MGRRSVGHNLSTLGEDDCALVFKGKGKGRFNRSRKGKGKGSQFAGKSSGKGKGRQLNPMGSDGRRMKCHTCGSEEHFMGECPQANAHWVQQENQQEAEHNITDNPNGAASNWLVTTRDVDTWLDLEANNRNRNPLTSAAHYTEYGPLSNLDDRHPSSRAGILPRILMWLPTFAGNVNNTTGNRNEGAPRSSTQAPALLATEPVGLPMRPTVMAADGTNIAIFDNGPEAHPEPIGQPEQTGPIGPWHHTGHRDTR